MSLIFLAWYWLPKVVIFFFQAEDGIRDYKVTGVQTCPLPICPRWPGNLDRFHFPGDRDRPEGARGARRRRDPLQRLVGEAVSRIGRMPITIPQGVEIRAEGDVVNVKGPKGELTSRIPPGITLEIDKGEVRFARANDEPQQRAWHGLLRSLVANSVEGVTKGFTRELEIGGVGYKAEVRGKSILFTLGYSHPIDFPIPEGINVGLDAKAGKLTVSGADRQKVGQTAA